VGVQARSGPGEPRSGDVIVGLAWFYRNAVAMGRGSTCEMEANMAGLSGGGVVSATARPVPGRRRGWGAPMRRRAVSAGGRLAWSEVAAT
jgi:hypothetical protein